MQVGAKPFLLSALLVLGLGSFALGDPMTDAANAGRAAAEDQLVLPGSPIFTEDEVTATVTPFETASPPEAALSGSTLEAAARARAAGTSDEAAVRRDALQASIENPRPKMTAQDPAITTADRLNQTATTTAGALFSSQGEGGTVCTFTGLSHAGTIERSCERSVSVDTFLCRQTLEVQVTKIDLYECDVKTPNSGASTTECAALSAITQCKKTAETCLNLAADGSCLAKRLTYTCQNLTADVAPARKIGATRTEVTDRTDETCDPAVKTSNCEAEAPHCLAGRETRLINGLPVTRECWAWNKPAVCQVPGLNSTCTVFEAEPDCTRIQSDCLARTDAGQCVHWEDRYRCEGTNQAEAGGDCKTLTVCAGGYCETVEPEAANEDFAASATWLNVLDEMAKDAEKSFPEQDLRVFDGADNSCRVGALGVLNCCNDSGWGNGLLGSCTEEEYDLMDRMVASATHYIGAYCSKRFFVCLQTRRVYCQFNSKLARVFNEKLRLLTGETWGTPRPSYRYVETCPNGGDRCTYTPVLIEGTGPNCEGVTVEEMETVDLEDIDLSEAFADFVESATVPTAKLVQDFLKSRVGSN